MARPTEPDDLKTLKGLIRFAKQENINSFKFNGWEFELGASNPNEVRLHEIEKAIKDLRATSKQLALRLEFKPKAGR